MKNNVFLILNKLLKTVITVALVIFVQSSTYVTESKVSNVNQNKTVNLSTMAMKIVENEENTYTIQKFGTEE